MASTGASARRRSRPRWPYVVHWRRCTGVAVLVGLMSTSGGSSAWALQGGEDPSQLPVLIDKRYGGENRHQLSLMFAATTFTKLTEGIGGYLAYQYNFTDMLGMELSGGFFSTGETFIMQSVRASTEGQEPFLPDQYALQWTAMANVVFVPFYGKMSFASEFDPSFDLFLVAGAGVVGARRAFGSAAGGEPERFESEVTWGVDVGGGFRFYLTDSIGLRFEFRNWLYPEPVEVPPEAQADGGVTSIGGVTSVLNFQAGVQFTFGGGS